TFTKLRPMSALPPKADISCACRDVRFVPKADSCNGNSFARLSYWYELSWTGPIERNVFARISRPLELKAERIHQTHDRFAPGYELSGSGLRSGWVHELRIFSG